MSIVKHRLRMYSVSMGYGINVKHFKITFKLFIFTIWMVFIKISINIYHTLYIIFALSDFMGKKN